MSIDLLKKTEEQKEKQKRWPNVLFFIAFGLLLFGSVAFTYYRIVVKKNYLISAEADCDPTIEKCFVYVCDPAAGEECTGDPEEDTSYYKIIKRKASSIPLCDPNDENCDALICSEGEADCNYELCEDGNADGIECNDPEQYNIDHPADEEESECEEGDEECLNASESECEEGDEECLSQEEGSDGEECDAETEDCSSGDDAEDAGMATE